MAVGGTNIFLRMEHEMDRTVLARTHETVSRWMLMRFMPVIQLPCDMQVGQILYSYRTTHENAPQFDIRSCWPIATASKR